MPETQHQLSTVDLYHGMMLVYYKQCYHRSFQNMRCSQSLFHNTISVESEPWCNKKMLHFESTSVDRDAVVHAEVPGINAHARSSSLGS